MSWTTEFNESYYIHSVGDTIIENDTLVKALRVDGDSAGDTTFLLMKNDTGVLIGYYSDNGFTDTLYKTIIDYSRTDSITSNWFSLDGNYNEYYSFDIIDVDTLYFSGKAIKLFNIDDGCDGPDIVYEGTFMWPGYPFFEDCFEVKTSMTCYSSHGITYNVDFFDFSQSGNGTCFLERVDLPNELTTSVEIYPNPATNHLTIETDRKREISIINSIGKVVYSA